MLCKAMDKDIGKKANLVYEVEDLYFTADGVDSITGSRIKHYTENI